MAEYDRNICKLFRQNTDMMGLGPPLDSALGKCYKNKQLEDDVIKEDKTNKGNY